MSWDWSWITVGGFAAVPVVYLALGVWMAGVRCGRW